MAAGAAVTFNNNNNNNDQEEAMVVTAEVVGASGRLGSQWMRLLAASAAKNNEKGVDGVRAVTRGLCPGSWTEAGRPIFVATPSSCWSQIYQVTPEHRRSDLVWTGNGLLSSTHLHQHNATVVIPHYGIMNVGGRPIISVSISPSSTAATPPSPPPPTLVYGKHASQTAALLRGEDGMETAVRIVSDWKEMVQAAGRKLLWASCLWLLCHYHPPPPNNTNNMSKNQTLSSPPPPLTVAQVHEQRSAELERLVRELWPVFRVRMQEQENKVTIIVNEEQEQETAIQETLHYFRDYSMSMPEAIPSMKLAQAGLSQRNLQFLSDQRQLQPFHYDLLETVLLGTNTTTMTTIATTLEQWLRLGAHAGAKKDERENDKNNRDTHVVHLPGLGISVYGRQKRIQQQHDDDNNIAPGGLDENATTRENQFQPRRIVIVGGGIMGSSIAMNLARIASSTMAKDEAHKQNSNTGLTTVVVVDQISSLSNQHNSGRTTRASWAWLNANQKSPPPAYQWLNQLGMHCWHRDPALRHLPIWDGSLVQVAKPLDDTNTILTGYPCQGPLSRERIRQLEPACVFLASDKVYDNDELEKEEVYPVYYFPQEGCVDPVEAVETMRRHAKTLSENNNSSSKVMFVLNRKVLNTIRNEQGEITGLLCSEESLSSSCAHNQDNNNNNNTSIISADLVISAAGVGSQSPCLGGIPLLNNTGTIALAKTTSCNELSPSSLSPTDRNRLLSRVLVDAVHESHVLQRRDGTLAIGGGYPQVGGASAVMIATKGGHSGESSHDNATYLVSKAAQHIAPTVLAHIQNSSIRLESAVRPMPMDGYPSVGFVVQPQSSSNHDGYDYGGKHADGGDTNSQLYSAVTHSGITLAPLLGALVAAEIYYDIDLVMLRPWRPLRFETISSGGSSS